MIKHAIPPPPRLDVDRIQQCNALCICRYIFHDRVERFLQRSPKRHGLSVTLRAVELAGPWKVVALLRLGPFPYHWLNYVLVRTLTAAAAAGCKMV
jgi:hypothetical protein